MAGPTPNGHRVAAVYLARMAEGLEPLRRFADSYGKHAAGVEHDLVVIYKGFDQVGRLEAARAVFASLPHVGIEVDDSGFDIGPYLEAARRLEHDYLCFMNTFTELGADGWLGSLYREAQAPGTGIAGAMGSYESLVVSSCVIHKVLWLCNIAAIAYDPNLAYYYDYVINDHCKIWSAGSRGKAVSPLEMLSFPPRQIMHRAKALASPVELFRRIRARATRGADSPDEQFNRMWKRKIGPGGDLETYSRFPIFPNPHVRSNGFMVARQLAREFSAEGIKTKMDACAFESGADSLTSLVRRRGLAARVVGKDGESFDVKDWWRSGTFRCGDQSKLLLSDNQSRAFGNMTAGARATHLRITWGDYAGAAPADFPGLGFSFPVDDRITN